MSNADKTREKLVNSMRKTKAGSEEKEKGTQTAQQPPTAKATSKLERSRKPAKDTPATAKSRPTPFSQGNTDPYQSGGRVWPD